MYKGQGAFLRALRPLGLSDQREGYTWLLSDRCGRLRLLFTPGQATALPLFPLLCLDLYRHAYALTYGNDRTAYVEAALPLINWEALSRRYKTVYTAQPPFPNPYYVAAPPQAFSAVSVRAIFSPQKPAVAFTFFSASRLSAPHKQMS